MAELNRIVIETGEKKVFASAIDWPGWSRSGTSEEDALKALADYVDRYLAVAKIAGVHGCGTAARDLEVVERTKGTGSTDFGVPDQVAKCDGEPMTEVECKRQLALLRACWDRFDDVACRVTSELRKGPRGGGRNRDEIVAHVVEADRTYGRKIGVRTPPFDSQDRDAVDAHREAVFAAIPTLRNGGLVKEKGWPARYAIRRMAWHILDHAWEMEDKDLTRRDGR